jgi:hypothetical protein
MGNDDVWGFPLCSYCFKPLQVPVAYISWTEARVIVDGYHQKQLCYENGRKTGGKSRNAGWRRKRNSWWEMRRRFIRGKSYCNLSTVTKLRSPYIYFPFTKSSKVEGSMRQFVIRWSFTVGIFRPSSYAKMGGGGFPMSVTLSFLNSVLFALIQVLLWWQGIHLL